MAVTIFPQKPSTCLATGTFGRRQSSKFDPFHLLIISKVKYNRFSVPKQNLLGAFRSGFRVHNDIRKKTSVAVRASAEPGLPPLPSDPSPGHWKVWAIGTIITVLLSFSKGKWGPLLKLEEKIETVIDEVKNVADVVEEVAEGVEKVAEAAAKHLPEGKLQDAAEFVEKLAEEIDKDAEIAQDALEKVDKLEENVESFIESTIHQENTVVATQAKDQK